MSVAWRSKVLDQIQEKDLQLQNGIPEDRNPTLWEDLMNCCTSLYPQDLGFWRWEPVDEDDGKGMGRVGGRRTLNRTGPIDVHLGPTRYLSNPTHNARLNLRRPLLIGLILTRTDETRPCKVNCRSPRSVLICGSRKASFVWCSHVGRETSGEVLVGMRVCAGFYRSRVRASYSIMVASELILRTRVIEFHPWSPQKVTICLFVSFALLFGRPCFLFDRMVAGFFLSNFSNTFRQFVLCLKFSWLDWYLVAWVLIFYFSIYFLMFRIVFSWSDFGVFFLV